jgi:hypothetical protein
MFFCSLLKPFLFIWWRFRLQPLDGKGKNYIFLFERSIAWSKISYFIAKKQTDMIMKSIPFRINRKIT